MYTLVARQVQQGTNKVSGTMACTLVGTVDREGGKPAAVEAVECKQVAVVAVECKQVVVAVVVEPRNFSAHIRNLHTDRHSPKRQQNTRQ